MSFTTPCFVRVDDAMERKKLIQWLKRIGYNHFPFIFESPFIATDSCGMIWVTDANRGGAYDAGTSVELFKALTAMNDENDYMQFFIHRKHRYEFLLCNTNRLFDCVACSQDYRKATADEIIEVFKKFTKN